MRLSWSQRRPSPPSSSSSPSSSRRGAAAVGNQFNAKLLWNGIRRQAVCFVSLRYRRIHKLRREQLTNCSQSSLSFFPFFFVFLCPSPTRLHERGGKGRERRNIVGITPLTTQKRGERLPYPTESLAVSREKCKEHLISVSLETPIDTKRMQRYCVFWQKNSDTRNYDFQGFTFFYYYSIFLFNVWPGIFF